MISATREYVYELNGSIYRYLTNSPRNRTTITGPFGVVTQIMATEGHLYALMDDGIVYRRLHDSDGWASYTVPPGATHLSADDKAVYALAGGEVFRQSDSTTASTSLPEFTQVQGIVQLDHDETFCYALTESSEIYFSDSASPLSLYPRPLSGVTQIASGLDCVYALSNGSVYRSKHEGYSGWVKMGDYEDIQSMCIATSHKDQLWFRHGGGLSVQGSLHWTKAKAAAIYWVESGWADPDWVMTEVA